jgi:uncharacterized membrane protein
MNNTLYPNALEANRTGRFSMSQAGGLVGSILIGSFLILLGILGISLSLSDFSLTNIAVSMLFLWLGYSYAGNIVIDVMRGSVQHIEGKGEKTISVSGKSVNRYFLVGEQKLSVPSIFLSSKLNNLETTGQVRAYYLPRSKVLVNLEW